MMKKLLRVAVVALCALPACSSDGSGEASTADVSASTSAAPSTQPPSDATAAATTTQLSTTTVAVRTGASQTCPSGRQLSDGDGDGWGSCILISTTTSAPEITKWDEGMYIVPDEMPPGAYRVFGYYARLDASQEILDNELVTTCPAILIVQPGDAYVELGGPALPLVLGVALDPIEEGCKDGVFLVGLDIQPGRYRIEPDGSSAYFARLDSNLEIIDNNLSDGQLIAEIRDGDFAFTFSGRLTRID